MSQWIPFQLRKRIIIKQRDQSNTVRNRDECSVGGGGASARSVASQCICGAIRVHERVHMLENLSRNLTYCPHLTAPSPKIT